MIGECLPIEKKMPIEPIPEAIAEELCAVYDIIINILECFPSSDDYHAAELQISHLLRQLARAKAHSEAAFELFDKLYFLD